MVKKGEKMQAYNPQINKWVLMEGTGKHPVWKIVKSQKKPFPGVKKKAKKNSGKKSATNKKAETGVTSSTIIPNFLEWF